MSGLSLSLPPYFIKKYKHLLGIMNIVPPNPKPSFYDLYHAHASKTSPEEAVTYAYNILVGLGWGKVDNLQEFANENVEIDANLTTELNGTEKFVPTLYGNLRTLGRQLGDYQLDRYHMAVVIVPGNVPSEKTFVNDFNILKAKLASYSDAVAFTISILERSGWGDTKELKQFASPNFDLNAIFPVVDLCLTVADYYGNMSDRDFSSAKIYMSAVHLNNHNVSNLSRVDFTLLLLERDIISVGDVSKVEDKTRYPVFFREYKEKCKSK